MRGGSLMYTHALFDAKHDFKITIRNNIEFLPVEDAHQTLKQLRPDVQNEKPSVEWTDLKQQIRNINCNRLKEFLPVEDSTILGASMPKPSK